MNESRDYLEMSFKSIQAFSDDGRLKAEELKEIVDIALRDGVIDQNEIRVLRAIIRRIQPHEVDAAMQAKLEQISQLIKGPARD